MNVEGVSGLVNRVIAWADGLQRRHAVLGFPYAVIKKYGDDEGGRQAALIAAVRYARLWPRALDLTRPTEADARALTLLAREQERIPAARVDFHLAPPDSPPVPAGSTPASDDPG